MNTCNACSNTFIIRDEDRVFYQKFDAPDPAACPECRLQQRLQFRNERTFYYRQSSLSGKKMISIYAPDSKHVVYSPEEWWSDSWDGLQYGRDFDFSRPFFEQFQELLAVVPRISLFNVNPQNSDYCQQAYNNKNCYLCTVVTKCEDCEYVTHSNYMKDSFDCTLTQNCELCYDCLDSDRLYRCVSCQSCQNSSNLMYCYDCIGCQDCFGCWGLRNKKFYIFNKKYSEEEYREKIASLGLGSYKNYLKYKAHFKELSSKAIHRADRNINTIDSSGNYLINAKNCHLCYDCYQIEDCAYSTWIFESNNCYDIYGLGSGQWLYFSLGVENLMNSAWNTFVSDGGDAWYSDLCFYSMNLFGCVGLRSKKNCIFNKEYSDSEYEDLKSRIIAHMKETGEWGLFFPPSLSPFAYNETAAQDLFPISKDQALAAGLRWRDPDQREYQAQSYEIPDNVEDIQPELLQQVLSCENCGKNYKVTQQELRYYRQWSVPVPHHCFDCRYTMRRALRNPRKLYERQCQKCQAPLQTTYSPDRSEIIYCQACYLQEVD